MPKKTSTQILEESDRSYGEIVLEPAAGANMITVENYHRSTSGILSFQSPAMSLDNVFIAEELVPLLFKLDDAWENDKMLPKPDGDRYRLVELIDYISHRPKFAVKGVQRRELSMVV